MTQEEAPQEIPDGLVICPSCTKMVPDSNVCINCASPLKSLLLPKLAPKELTVMRYLSGLETEATIDEIRGMVGGAKEGIRVVLSELYKFGLVSRPSRGRYIITKHGREYLKSSGVAMKKPNTVVHIDSPEFLSISSMYRILGSAGQSRFSGDAPNALAGVLERVGSEIAGRAVELAGEARRVTVRPGDMEAAIIEILGEGGSEDV